MCDGAQNTDGPPDAPLRVSITSAAPSYGSTAGCPLSPKQPPASDLPDLSHRLIEAGTYREYVTFKERYLQWRKGRAKGATGELTANALQQQTEPSFEHFYPTASIFKWRYSMSYWKSILYLIGSLLFLFDSMILLFHPKGSARLTRIAPGAIGACFFSLATYLGYLGLINIATPESESVVYLIPDFDGMFRMGAQISSVLGAVFFFLGAMLFNMSSLSEVFEASLSPIWKFSLLNMTNAIGSIFFVLGSISELVHNGVFTRDGASWREMVFWAAWCDMLGSIGFFVAAFPGIFSEHGSPMSMRLVYFGYLVGSFLFVCSSVLLICMWRINNFGMTLVRQLNLLPPPHGQLLANGSPDSGMLMAGQASPVREGRRSSASSSYADEAAPPALVSAAVQEHHLLSMRDTFYIIAYCWFAFVAISNCLFREQRLYFLHSKLEMVWMDIMMDFCMQVFVLVVISLVLVLHSVVVEVPDEQPYYCTVITARIVLICGAVVQTFWFVKFWT
eukprot:CAMPEP_0206547270 /NCGR_PEP_ID=MMETSP0325_2-20121206/13198_1 /ASSEMBLY_ACC=CAM_ASM_000347 /TAXON_ID=2866 /ORGANISM="Crypthecodinium cohnii, Strain Seligo" /LENGTH=504 /DNA_ID=CAMNT_0054046547 /DNA_START=145 /DNA_END=1655 /DNA_ORIENTATION=+